MMLKYLVALILINCINAANILVILSIASPSYHVFYSPYLIELASRGHNLTVLSPTAQKTKIPNLTDLEVTGIIEEINEEQIQKDYETMTEVSIIEGTHGFFLYLQETCKKIMKSNAWNQLMNYPSNTKFDLVILEAVGTECLVGSIQKFGKSPIIVVNGFMMTPWMYAMLGTPNMVSHTPHECALYPDVMTFRERVENFAHNMYQYFGYFYCLLPKMDKMAKETFGTMTPSFYEVWDRISLGLVNFHPAIDYAWAKTPNLIPIAGMQVKDPKPLTEDLKKFLDEAKDGAILFSLGSNIKSKNISPEKKQAILETFAELPQKILWKFEADNLPGLPSNVKIGKWLPQSDILAHPNIKLFISHSGLFSTIESIYREVPVLGIPFYADQHTNIKKLIRHGAGRQLSYKDITKVTLYQAIHSMLHNSSYKENMKVLSQKLKDNPETPLERAVFWTEYVIRHKGAYHLRSAALDLNMVQYLLLDVIAFVLAIPVFLLSVFYLLCCRRKSKDRKKLKTN